MSDALSEREEPTGASSGLLANDNLVRRIGEVVAGLFLAVVLGVLGWTVFSEVDPDLLQTIFPRFVTAYLLVIRIVIVSSILSVSAGIIVGLARISSSPLTSNVARGYIEFFRGTPLLFQLFLIYFGIPSLWGTGQFPISDWEIPAAVIGLTLNHAAYVGEAMRGGINAVPDGQMEAARSIGMSRVQAMREVILPQAWRNALAAIGNDQIILVKDTSLLTLISVPEIMQVFRSVNSATFDPWTPLVWVCLFYLAVTLPMSKLVGVLEARADWGSDRKSLAKRLGSRMPGGGTS
ncbi:amino acid ABC transporter permease [Haloarchaeobius sp. FL176]|uniref:amino acid ABC transporter permease n=1 Tax=Haloarchaeobius sp. FL176 TaxID=2967129 RepID=UPI0021486FF9|nr:amino acid ABC transporter permease [Haloarchaeobius sp. FL176]